MTREEAITYLKVIWNRYKDEYEIERETLDAYHVAIEALQEPKTIIGIDIPYGSDKGLATIFKGNEKMVLEEVKEIMLVVHCEDCQWRADVMDVDTGVMYHICGVLGFDIPDGFACNQGKRKGADDDL